MRNNQPVTQQEYTFDGHSTLPSTTDTQSHIVHADAGVGDLDEMTQQNAALVKESAAAASTLNHQSRSMKNSVGIFA